MPSQGKLARILADIDQMVNDAIADWGGEATPSEKSLRFLRAARDFAIANQIPSEDLQSIHRLRLYAYAYDVLNLLAQDSSPAVATSARSFVVDVSTACGDHAVQGQARLPTECWTSTFQAILSSPRGRNCKSDPELIHNVVTAVRQLNRCLLPEPVNFKAHSTSIKTNAFVERQEGRPREVLLEPVARIPDAIVEQQQEEESHVAWCLNRVPREEAIEADLFPGLPPRGAGVQLGGQGGPLRTSPVKARSEPYRPSLKPCIEINEESPDPIVDATPSQAKAPAQPSLSLHQHRAEACTVNGKSRVADNRVPAARLVYTRWTAAEEEELIKGHKRWSNHWELIHSNSPLLKKKSHVQLKDKWRNLLKAGRVTERD